jgi:tRNA(Ile)-lysidine synthase
MPLKPDHYHPLVRDVAVALRKRCGVVPGDNVVIACSGGADSVALLRAMHLLASRRTWRLGLVVGHVQHHLRDAAEDDADFVEALAHEFGLPYARRDIRPADLPGNLEANASRLRYAALADIAGEHLAQAIATAHHADDQLETLLMRMLRGTGVAGLRGIAWRKPNGVVPNADDPSDAPATIIRPMLGVTRDSALDLLTQLNQPHRHDDTNDDTTRTRARLRAEVLPVLKSLKPDAAEKANDLADHFRNLYTLLQHATDDACKQREKGSGVVLLRSEARAMNPLVLAEVLRRSLGDRGVPKGQLTRQALHPLVAAARDRVGGRRAFAFARGISVQVTRDAIAIGHASDDDSPGD